MESIHEITQELHKMRASLLKEVQRIDALILSMEQGSGPRNRVSEGTRFEPMNSGSENDISLERLQRDAVSVRISVPLEDPADFQGHPGLKSRHLTLTVDLFSGAIHDWPEKFQGELCVYEKVCDAGVYQLLGQDGSVLATHTGYVPDKLVPGEFGDYLELIIRNGVITNWYAEPELTDFVPTAE